MVPTFWLLGLVLAPAQAPSRPYPGPSAPALRGDWSLTPQLARGQELLYRGTFTEEAKGARVQFHRDYRFEARYFVLDAPPRGLEVAVLTTLKSRLTKVGPGVQINPTSTSVRLERVLVDLRGKVTTDTLASLAIPLEGAPTIECGAFVESPGKLVSPGRTWDRPEQGRPPIGWHVVGREVVFGTSCIKVVATQQSPEWDRPRAGVGAWRRTDTIWMAPRLGVAQRVERVIEQREPARTETSQRSVLHYDLESSLQYPGALSEDRRQEINQALAFRDGAAPMLTAPAKYSRQLAVLKAKIEFHLQNQPPTPYREGVFHVKRQVEAGLRGEAAPAPMGPSMHLSGALAIGEKAPDFAASDFASSTVRLSHYVGKPVVLVFYSPTSVTAPELLGFAQGLSTTFARHATILGLSVSDDSKVVLDQRAALKLTFPLLFGGGLRINYAVETTPKIVVIDATGAVRGAYVGWGRETPTEVLAELRHWIGAH